MFSLKKMISMFVISEFIVTYYADVHYYTRYSIIINITYNG